MGRDERRAAWGTFYHLIGLAGFLALWWVAAETASSAALMPSPLRILALAWRETLAGELPRQMAITLARVGVAFIAAMTIGSLLGYAMGRLPRLNAVADPLLVIALNLPVLVTVILAYIWVGLNDVAAVLAVVVAKAPTVTVTVREGTRALDPVLGEMATVFRLTCLKRARMVVLPQLAPYLAAAGRSGLSITWKIVLVVELLGRPNGVGFALNLYFQNFDVTGILAYGLAFAALMLLVEALVLQPVERRANRWRADA